ncbi:AraC family transcriptional regulator [Variovorax saccharolyticus]|uniref:AraC family transcriptional regulator n=1 Tax=Variovorax saccharolyticus TaxID=3053516 RepID=UPI002574B681|nr:AraC family transcriptional regulator [Variovorax sp. J31P216]MDM0026117.1 AraC family transcriptional regulator [Variovorax sp. J31P216]
MPYLIRAASLTNYVKVARSVGLEPFRHLRAAGIHPSVLLDPDMKVPTEAVGRLLESSAQASGCEDFGLRMAETRELSNLGPLAFVAREEPTLRKTLVSMAYYARLQNEALLIRIEEADGLTIIRQEMMGGHPGSIRQQMQLIVGVVHRTLAVFLGTAWKPRSVCFIHGPPPRLNVYRRVFGAPVLFDQDFDGIVCQTTDLDVAVASYEPDMARHTRRYLDALLAQSDATMIDQVRKLVFALLPTGTCSMTAVAQQLGVQARTLQRHLEAQGESYSSILDAARAEVVPRYVASRDRPLSEVASLLGFASLSAFSRWFTGRFGCSVSTWRT